MKDNDTLPENTEAQAKAAAGTEIHSSRLAGTTQAYQDPENHLFRKAYRQLSPGEAKLMDAIKDKAFELHNLCQSLPVATGPSDRGRYLALAKTALEESVMWAVKAITY